MTLAFSSHSPAETPRGSAASNIVQRVGAPFGVTVIAVILQHSVTRAATAHQVVDAFGTTFWWIFALSLVPLVLAVFLPGQRRGRPAAGAAAPAGDGEREG